MEKKENVYGEATQTENAVFTATGQDCKNAVTAPEKVSTDLGKFRSVDALLRAYEALEAEFTRRSQRLKELEREADNLSASVENARGERNGAEKLRKNAAQRRQETRAFDDFVSDLESVGAHTEKTLEAEAEKPAFQTVAQLNENATESEVVNEQTIAKPSVAGGRGEESLSADAIYELAKKDEGVRLKIIGEYLSSLGKSSVPLMTGGMGTFASPPRKAANITEAGDMALLYLKKPSNR